VNTLRIKADGAPRSKFRSIALDIKDAEIQADGTFTGYASVFGEIDTYGEIVRKGAFAKSLKAWAKKGKLPRMLWQHRSDQIIGVWLEMVEDQKGLRVKGRLALDVDKGREAYALLKIGALDGLSIGYVATEWTTDSKAGTTTLDVIDLWEVSVVTFQAGPSAVVDGVKSSLDSGKLPTLPEFEEYLREAGFSRSEAKAIAGKGLSHLLRQREADDKREVSVDDILSVINPS
jgi:HK97 family phage prohead protease